MKNIVLMNFGGLGDEILFLPVIQSLKKKYQDCQITLVAEPRSAGILQLTSLINKVITCDVKSKFRVFELLKLIFRLRQGEFDMIISSGASVFISIILFLSGIKERYGYDTGFLSNILLTKAIKLNKKQYAGNMYHNLVSAVCDFAPELPKIEIENSNLTNPIQQPLKIPDTDKKIILIHPGCSKLSKEKGIIKSYDNWVELIEKLQKTDKYQIVLAGGPDDEEVIQEISSKLPMDGICNMYGKTKNIKDLIRLIKMSDLLVCIDSAPLHLAVGVNKKTLAIFGPTDEKKLVPDDNKFNVISNYCACRPCLWDKRDRCCENINCLKISPDKVFEEIENML